MLRCVAAVLILLVGSLVQAQNNPSYEGKTLKEWVKQLQDKSPERRQEAAFALGQMTYRGAPAVPALREALKDSAVSVRAEAADSLGRIGGASREATPALLDILKKDPETMVRGAVAHALGQIAGKDVVPALAQALKDREPQVRVHAAMSLGRLGAQAKEAIPALREALKDSHGDVRRNARLALKRIDLRAAP
jgi:HEAT repeat protein